jgi:hypothetical protein
MEGTPMPTEPTDGETAGRTSKLRRVRDYTGDAVEAARKADHRWWIDELDVLVNLGLQAAGREGLPGHPRFKITVEPADD